MVPHPQHFQNVCLLVSELADCVLIYQQCELECRNQTQGILVELLKLLNDANEYMTTSKKFELEISQKPFNRISVVA